MLAENNTFSPFAIKGLLRHSVDTVPDEEGIDIKARVSEAFTLKFKVLGDAFPYQWRPPSRTLSLNRVLTPETLFAAGGKVLANGGGAGNG